MDEVQVLQYRRTIKKKLFILKLRYRFQFFFEACLIGFAVVFGAAALIVGISKVFYISERIRSVQYLLGACAFAALFSLIWALIYPLRDGDIAAHMDSELDLSGRMESAIDFLDRFDEIDRLFLVPFMDKTQKILTSTPNKEIVSIETPWSWKPAAIALLVLFCVNTFLPSSRFINENQDPFLIRDMHRLSNELEGLTIQSRRQTMTDEEKELFKRAEELSRRMDVESIDPDYLQDELSRLSRDISKQSQNITNASDELLARIKAALEEIKNEQQAEPSEDQAFQQAVEALENQLRMMQQQSMSERAAQSETLDQMVESLRQLMDQRNTGDANAIRQLVDEMKEQSQRDQLMRNMSDTLDKSLRSLNKDSVRDLVSPKRNLTQEQAERILQNQQGIYNRMSDEFRQNMESGSQSGLSDSNGQTAGDSAQGQSEEMTSGSAQGGIDSSGSANSEGAGTGEGEALYGEPTGSIDGPRTKVSNIKENTSDDMDLTFTTVLGEASQAESGKAPSGDLAMSSEETYEGDVSEAKFPEKYRQIISNYFDSLN